MPAPSQPPVQAPSSAQFDPTKLADISLPEAITFWPVAPGWWLLLGIIIIFLVLIIYLAKRKPTIPVPTGKQLKSQAMQELHVIREDYYFQNHKTQNHKHNTVKKLSIFLRRYALSLYQRDDVASLTDEQWLSLLDNIINHHLKQSSDFGSTSEHSSENGPFSNKFSALLTQIPYQSAQAPIDEQLLTELFVTSELLIKNSFKHFTAMQKPLARKKPLAGKKPLANKKPLTQKGYQHV